MRRLKRKYKRPRKLFDKARMDEERELLKKYGLRRKREIWRAETILRKFRRITRRLIAEENPKLKEELINKLKRLGIVEKIEKVDDILNLTVEDILKRRLQTILYLKGMAKTPKHARQLIVHGHVLINNRKVIWPSYLVPKEEEDKITIVEKRKSVPKESSAQEVSTQEAQVQEAQTSNVQVQEQAQDVQAQEPQIQVQAQETQTQVQKTEQQETNQVQTQSTE